MDNVSPANAEAQRWLVIAWKLLEARDFPAAKKFAERAIDADPLLDGPDQIIAAADVLLASQRPLPSGDADHYHVLQLPRPSDLPSIKCSFRRLSLLLRHQSSSPPNPVFHLALDLVSDSFSFLSNDDRRRLYDRDLPTAKENSNSKINTSNSKLSPPPPPTQEEDEKKVDEEEKKKSFWTVCPNCFRAFEYAEEYEGRRLRCHVCRNPFHAARLPTPPPVIPGTDMFYCSWGVFPVGFPGYSSIQVPPGTTTVPSFPSFLPEPAKVKEDNVARSIQTPTTETLIRKKAPRKVMAKRPRPDQSGADHSNRVVVQGVVEDGIGSGIGAQSVVIGGGGGVGIQGVVQDGNHGIQSGVQDGIGSDGGDSGGGFDVKNRFEEELDHSSAVLGISPICPS